MPAVRRTVGRWLALTQSVHHGCRGESTPRNIDNFGVEWYRPIEAYIGQHVQLVTAHGKIYVATARGLYALDAATGDIAWRFDTDMPLGHSPTVAGNAIFVGGTDRRVYALDADSGEELWVFAQAKGGFSTNPVVADGKVLLGSRDGRFYAIDQGSGMLMWQYPEASQPPLGPILYSAAYKNGVVYFASNDNHAYALNAASGSLVWKSDVMPGDGYQAWWPVIYGNYVIFRLPRRMRMEATLGPPAWRVSFLKMIPITRKCMSSAMAADFVNYIQRDDTLHQGEDTGDYLGRIFESGSVSDTTGIRWSWGKGKLVVSGRKLAQIWRTTRQTDQSPTQQTLASQCDCTRCENRKGIYV